MTVRDDAPLQMAEAATECAEYARGVRDRFIREAHQSGWDYRRIARVTKLAPKTVRWIVENEETDDEAATA